MLSVSLLFRTVLSKCATIYCWRLQYSTCLELHSQSIVRDLRREKFTALLETYGFNQGQINRLFKSEHNVLSLHKNDLQANLMNWLKFEQGDKLYTTLSAYPELLILNPDFVNFRVTELMTLFTRKDINKLMITCPRVFLDDFSEIYDKVEYLVHFMKAEQKSIVKSNALQFDINHIKCRHSFLTRVGCYTTKKDAKRKNLPLAKIFNKNIQTFLNLVNLTEEEYIVFTRCFEDEIDLEDEDIEDYFDVDEE